MNPLQPKVQVWRDEVKRRLGQPIDNLPICIEVQPDGRTRFYAFRFPERVFVSLAALEELEGVRVGPSGEIAITNGREQAVYRVVEKEDICERWFVLERVS